MTGKKTLPKELDRFISIVLKSKNPDEAFNRIRAIKDVPHSTSKTFFDLYGGDGDRNTPRQAFDTFYNDVKSGNYIVEGEMEFIKKIIKEELERATLDNYKRLITKHNHYYMMSDDDRTYRKGKAVESKIEKIYSELSPEDKLEAAIYYKELVKQKGLFKGSKSYQKIMQWNPDITNIEQDFDGTAYTGR